MIPFRTTAPGARMPAVTMTLIVANIGVFFYQLDLSPTSELRFLYHYALVPAIYTNPDLVRHLGLGSHHYWPIITNTFLHGGFLHLIFNMWTLWLFGIAVEGRMRTLRFLFFYLACGAVGSLGHLAFNLGSTVPALGASGAIAGLLGGYARLFPRAKVTLIQPIFFLPVIFSIPAIAYTAVWFALQVWQGTASLGPAAQGAGIAWWAHIGGFMAGLILVRIVAGPMPPPPSQSTPSGITLRRRPWNRRGPWD